MASKSKSSRADVESLTEAMMEKLLDKQRNYLEPRLAQIQQLGGDTDAKLTAIQAKLDTLTASINAINTKMEAIEAKADSNSKTLDQGCTTYGPRARYGPLKLSVWPAKVSADAFLRNNAVTLNSLGSLMTSRNTATWCLLSKT